MGADGVRVAVVIAGAAVGLGVEVADRGAQRGRAARPGPQMRPPHTTTNDRDEGNHQQVGAAEGAQAADPRARGTPPARQNEERLSRLRALEQASTTASG